MRAARVLIWGVYLALLAVAASAAMAALIESNRAISLFCGVGGCDSVLSSRYAKWFGIPVAGIGVVGLSSLLVVAIWINRRLATHDPTTQSNHRRDLLALQTLSSVAAIIAAGLIAVQIRWIGKTCLLCLIIDISVIVAAAAALHLQATGKATAKAISIFGIVSLLVALAAPITWDRLRPSPQPPAVVTDRATDRAADGSSQNVVVINSAFGCPGCRQTHAMLEAAIDQATQTVPSLAVHRRWLTFAKPEVSIPATRAYYAALTLDASAPTDPVDQRSLTVSIEQFLLSRDRIADPVRDDSILRFIDTQNVPRQTFVQATQSKAVQSRITRDAAEFETSGVPGVPSVWVNETLFYGPLQMKDAAAAIEGLSSQN